MGEMILTERQRREQQYHLERAHEKRGLIDQSVAVDILAPAPRRPWNAYWSLYDRILSAGLAGKRVLVPGCGFGDDAIRLAMLGADVSAFDLSAASIEIAAARAANAGLVNIRFDAMPAEATTYADSQFDAVLFVDILHHVDIAATMREIRRVLKPSAIVIGDELYTHTALQRIRESRFVAKVLHPAMTRWIYGTNQPYVTEDEHKIDQHEFGVVLDTMASCSIDYFGLAQGRLFPDRLVFASRIDRMLMRLAGPLGSRLCSRVVFTGRLV